MTRSSEPLEWPNVSAELHALEPGRATIGNDEYHELGVHVGAPHPLWERADGRAKQSPHRRGDVLIVAAGERRELAWNRPTRFLGARVSARYVRAVAESLDRDLDTAPIHGSPTGAFPEMERVLTRLHMELSRSAESDPMVLETLVMRLAVTLLGPRSAVREPSTLAPRQLRRVFELVHDSLEEPLRLAELANVAGLSTFHFARAFRASVGVAPHRYVVDARVDEARRLILDGASPADASASVGFHSQGHLTRHMKRLLGVTPGQLARSRRNPRAVPSG